MSVTVFNQNQEQEDKIQPESQEIPKQENNTVPAEDEPIQTNTNHQNDEEQIKLQEQNIKNIEAELPAIIKNEPSGKNLLSAYLIKPKKIAYNGQLKEESIVLLLRQHPITLSNKIIIAIFGLIFPLLFFTNHWIELVGLQYQVGILLGWYLLIFGFVIETFLSWYFGVFIITDRRVIDVDFYSMIHKDIAAAKLENIQDVNYVTIGVLASLIDYGTIYLQTAGEKAKIEFEKVPHPSEVAKIINEMIAFKKRSFGRGYLKKAI